MAYLHAVLDGRQRAETVLWWRLEILKRLLVDPRTRLVGVGVKRNVRRARTRLAYMRSLDVLVAEVGRTPVREDARLRRAGAAGRVASERGGEGATRSWRDGVVVAALRADVRYDLRRLELLHDFRETFPDREDELTSADFAWYTNSRSWAELFDRYDVVQCYATDPIVALLAATRPYVAFEHGTLRDFTLGDNPIHRLNALAYRSADHVFITNGDCLEYAERLGIERFTPMIHPVDVDQHEQDCGGAVAEYSRSRRLGRRPVLSHFGTTGRSRARTCTSARCRRSSPGPRGR